MMGGRTNLERPGRTQSPSDTELVSAARRGDKRAFVEIVARHQAMVCGIALGILGDFGASEDAGQEAFLTAWRKIKELREPARLKAWLAQIARNAALSQLRRKHTDEVLQDEHLVLDDAPQPDEAAASQDDAALIRNALARLPETYRLPLILFYRQGQSVRAAAETLGISEDATKQRLARGREMLREQMARKIETALVRTAPNAVFTMTVAALIGALAAPAAVAGAAFAAASLSSATTAAGSSPSLVTIMSTSKAFLVSTVVVATICVPIGYQILPEPTPSSALSLPDASSVFGAPSNAPPGMVESALLAEWRALHDRYGTNAQAMPRLDQAISALPDRFRRQAFRAALVAEWAEVDPAGGLPFFLGKERDETQRRQFFEAWLARNPHAAIDGLLGGGAGWEALARDCLRQIARVAPDRVPEIAARVPRAERPWDRAVQDAFAILGERNLATTRQVAEGLSGGSRNEALEGVAEVWARSDFKAVVEWARSLPGEADRDEIIRSALTARAAVDPLGALDSIGLVPAGGRYAHAGTTTGAKVLAKAAETDFGATAAWVASHPGLLGRDDLDGLSRPVTARLNANAGGFLSERVADGSLSGILPAIGSALLNKASGARAAVWEWCKTQPETEAIKELQENVLSSAAFQEPPLALQLVADLPDTPEGDKQVKELARCLFNGGHALSRFDTLYLQSSDRLRQPLVETAFQCLHGTTLDDPRKWLGRLALLPETSRRAATEALAKAWGGQIPEEAMNWAATLPPGETQESAMAALTSGWAARDALGAAEWLASLPSGPQRDRNAAAFASAVAEAFPQEAWAWATSISDEPARMRAASDTLKRLAVRDPLSARQWIETGPFTAENKTQLYSTVESASGDQK